VADLDAAFMQQVLDVAKRQWEPNVHHYGQPDDLGRSLEAPERAMLGRGSTVGDRPVRLDRFSSDTAAGGTYSGAYRDGLRWLCTASGWDKRERDLC